MAAGKGAALLALAAWGLAACGDDSIPDPSVATAPARPSAAQEHRRLSIVGAFRSHDRMRLKLVYQSSSDIKADHAVVRREQTQLRVTLYARIPRKGRADGVPRCASLSVPAVTGKLIDGSVGRPYDGEYPVLLGTGRLQLVVGS